MASKSKVSVSSEPTTKHRLTSAERQAARAAEIANKQSELKSEAAARRAKRAAELEAKSEDPRRSTTASRRHPSEPPDSRPSNIP